MIRKPLSPRDAAWAAICRLGAVKLRARQKFGWNTKAAMAACKAANLEIDRLLQIVFPRMPA